jgi:hypothetical protein
MNRLTFWGRSLALVAALLFVVSGPALAQLQTGSLFGTVSDDQGSVLPGVTVTLTTSSVPQVQVTDAQGRFRFLSLGPGSYGLKAELEGFSPVDYPTISINVGRSTELQITLNSAVKDVITVTTESPLLDQRRISTGATVSQTELEKIPTARDPWAILQTTPGVLTDRINVGGNESGQQSQYVGPGSAGEQSVWSVDGVVITDMGANGSSPAYYDFDSFEELQVTTGGSDSSIATGGVVLNMVTKRGTNEWRGSGRYYVADKSWQSDTSFDNSDLARAGAFNNSFNGTNNAQPPFKSGNRIVKVEDYGAELGGPIIKDRLWVWGSYAKPKIDLLTVSDVSDFTELETENLKFNAQITPSNSATLFALQSDKVKLGRNAGPTRTQPTTWNQQKFGDDPTALKLEDTHVFSSSFYLTGLYSVVNGGFELAPQGGLDITPYRDNDLVWQNSYVLAQIERPQKQYKGDGSSYFNTGSLSHELKFGAGYREVESNSLSRWPGVGLQFGEPGDFYTLLARDSVKSIRTKYTSAYAQDTLSHGNLTINFGLRYDKQTGTNLPTSAQANPLFPDLLPAVNYAGGDVGFDWTDVTPRIGLTYALGKDRKTLLRASYSQFADQLGTGVASWSNPMYPPTYVYGYSTNNGGPTFSRNEFTPNGGASGNYNPVTKGLLISNAIDPNLSAPTTDELLLSAEHALLPEFVVGLNLTYRKYKDILEYERLVFDGNAYSDANLNSVGRVHRRSDYVQGVRNRPEGSGLNPNQGVLPNGQGYNLVYYELRPGVSTRNGFYLHNGEREQDYKGAALTFNKRLSNRWMLRGNFSYSDWTWDAPDSSNEDPTITLPNLTGAGIRDGDQVVQGSGTGSGAKGNVFINSKWSYSLNGLYQIAPDRPWALNVAASLTGRQGYPEIYYERFGRATLADGAGLGTPVLIEGASDSQRYKDVNVLDLRVEKEFTFENNLGLTISADVFNVTNEATVMQRQTRLFNATGNYVQEILSPRIFRLGARFSFR